MTSLDIQCKPSDRVKIARFFPQSVNMIKMVFKAVIKIGNK